LQAQRKAFEKMGWSAYLKTPEAGTHPKGIEIAPRAVEALLSRRCTRPLEVNWQRPAEGGDEAARGGSYSLWLPDWELD